MRTATLADRPWPPETCAIVVGAAAASVFALVVWLGVLWRYVQPSAFGGRLLLGPIDFPLYVLRGVFAAVVLLGAVAALLRRRWARRFLLAGGLGVVAHGLAYFAKVSIHPYGPERGADVVYNVTDRGVWFVNMYLPHLLLVLAMAWPGARGRPRAEASAAAEAPAGGVGAVQDRRLLPYSEHVDDDADRVQVRRAIVVAAGVDALASLSLSLMLFWVALQPSAFQSIGTNRSYLTSFVPIGSVASELTLIVGAVALLARRRWGRPLVLAGAAMWFALLAWSWTMTWVFRRSYLPRYRGAEWVVNVTSDTSQRLTTAVVYALLVFVLLRAKVRYSGTQRG